MPTSAFIVNLHKIEQQGISGATNYRLVLDLTVASMVSVENMNKLPPSKTGETYSITQVSLAAGITSRTLRHYDQIGLLRPSWTAPNGYRHYSQSQLIRLQRILLLRQFGMKLETIREVLDQQQDEAQALRSHVQELEHQRTTIDQQISSLKRSLKTLEHGRSMNIDSAFEGFNDQHKDEVISRWGEESFTESNSWWKQKPDEDRDAFVKQVHGLNERWARAGAAGLDPTGEQAQLVAAEHVRWLNSIPGTPGRSGNQQELASYVSGLAQMYVADERFAANYQGQAPFVKAALDYFVKANLSAD